MAQYDWSIVYTAEKKHTHFYTQNGVNVKHIHKNILVCSLIDFNYMNFNVMNKFLSLYDEMWQRPYKMDVASTILYYPLYQM